MALGCWPFCGQRPVVTTTQKTLWNKVFAGRCSPNNKNNNNNQNKNKQRQQSNNHGTPNPSKPKKQRHTNKNDDNTKPNEQKKL